MIEVVLRWSGDVVEVVHVDGKLTVGRAVDDDLFVPLEHADSCALVDKSEHGFMLHVPAGMRGFILHHRERIDVPAHGLTIGIDDDTRAHLASGAFTIEVRKARRSRLPLLAPLFDALWANTATLTLAAMGIVVAALSLGTAHVDDAMPPIVHTLVAHTAARTAHLGAPTKATQQKQLAHGPQPQRANASPKRTPHASDARVVEEKLAQLFGAGAMKELVGGDRFAETVGAIGAIGGSMGGASGESKGALASAGNLGIHNVAWRGETDTIEVGHIGTVSIDDAHGSFGGHRERDLPVALPAVIDEKGRLDPEIVKRVVREHVSQIRYCYERELTHTPGIAGKVRVKWVIGADGKVSSVAVLESELHDANVEACLSAKIRTWVFPKLEGGGGVVVQYPFVFKRAR